MLHLVAPRDPPTPPPDPTASYARIMQHIQHLQVLTLVKPKMAKAILAMTADAARRCVGRRAVGEFALLLLIGPGAL